MAEPGELDLALQQTHPPARNEAPHVPWGLPQGAGSVLLAFAIYLIGAVIVATIVGIVSKDAYDRHITDISIVDYQFLAGGTALCVVLLYLRNGRRVIPSLGFRYPGFPWMLSAALSVIPILIAISIFYYAFSALFPGFHLQGNARELVSGSSGSIPLAEKVVIFIFAALQAPIVEETLFRGILFQGLRETMSRRMPYQAAVAVAAVASGTVFGLLHFQPQTLPVLVLLGIILAYVFQLARSIYASMVVHALFNAIAVVAVLQGT